MSLLKFIAFLVCFGRSLSIAESPLSEFVHHHSTSNGEHDEQKQPQQQFTFAKVSGGWVKGRVSYAAGPTRPARVFLGVPMAEPPVGELRWRELKTKKPWHGVADATRYRSACLSNTTATRSPQRDISEDCIYANIFADPKCMIKSCPILFYIHGGGFRFDSAVMFNQTQIAAKYGSDGVVFIITAFRLGVIGLLDLQDESVVKKNLGVYDVLYGLRWAQRELRAFGGDPKRITVMGNSGGAMATIILATTPLLREDDFQAAIVSSGGLNLIDEYSLRPSVRIVAHFNCTRKFARATLDCLRKVPALELLSVQQSLESELSEIDGRPIIFGPCADGKLIPGPTTIDQFKLWRKNLPTMITTTLTENENSVFRKTSTHLKTSPGDECQNAEMNFVLNSPEVHQACIRRYAEAEAAHTSPHAGSGSMHADAVRVALVNRRRGSPSYVGSFQLANYSGHADDMAFFFGLHMNYTEVTRAELLMDSFFPSMIKRFVKTHKPFDSWKPVDRVGRGYYLIDFVVNDAGIVSHWPHFVAGEYSDPESVDFWLRQMPALEKSVTKGTPFSSMFLALNDYYSTVATKWSTVERVEDLEWVESSSNFFSRLSTWIVLTVVILAASLVCLAIFSRKRRRGGYFEFFYVTDQQTNNNNCKPSERTPFAPK